MENCKIIHLEQNQFDDSIERHTYEEDGYWTIAFGIFYSHKEMKEFSLGWN